MTIACGALLAVAVPANLMGAQTSVRATAEAELDRVVQIEREFAQASLKRGVKRSFLEYAAPDGVIFRPSPVPAVATIQKDPDDDQGATLDWWPVMGAIAQSADLALSVGPWVINDPTAKEPQTQRVYGYYATVWRKQADGSWKFVIDGAGARLRQPPARARASRVVKLPVSAAPPISADAALSQVRAIEAALSRQSEVNAANAIRRKLARGSWLMGSGAEPSPGPAGWPRELADLPPNQDFALVGGGASEAGDFVYTYGIARASARRAPAETGTYLRVWQRTVSGWRIIFQGIKRRR